MRGVVEAWWPSAVRSGCGRLPPLQSSCWFRHTRAVAQGCCVSWSREPAASWMQPATDSPTGSPWTDSRILSASSRNHQQGQPSMPLSAPVPHSQFPVLDATAALHGLLRMTIRPSPVVCTIATSSPAVLLDRSVQQIMATELPAAFTSWGVGLSRRGNVRSFPYVCYVYLKINLSGPSINFSLGDHNILLLLLCCHFSRLPCMNVALWVWCLL